MSESTPTPPPSDDVSSPKPLAPKSFPAQVWDWLACFRSIQLAIILLSLLAVGTLIGVLMPQEGLVDVVQIKRTYGESYRLLKAMGLFNVYSSYWFIALEVLFFFNLLFGSFQWLKPAFLSATKKRFVPAEGIARAEEHGQMVSPQPLNPTMGTLTQLLKKHRFGVYQNPKDPTQLYATKGNFSRLGPVVAHFGILLLLIFSVYGAFTGFKAQKLAAPGETFTLRESEFFMPNVHASVWQGTVPNWRFHVKDFRIETYPDHPETVKQYYCTLQILDTAGKVLKEKVISVNYPLTHEDLTVYQASYAPTGKLFLELNGKKLDVTVNSQFQNRPINITPLTKDIALVIFPFFVQQDPGAKNNHIVVFLQKDGQFVGGGKGKMPTNLRLTEGQSGQLANLTLKYVKPEIATGLQIKQAPEVGGMYLAFAIIALGTFMCIFSQRMIWVGVQPRANGVGQDVFFLYKTNKAKVSFYKELARLEAELQAQWPQPPAVAPSQHHPHQSQERVS